MIKNFGAFLNDESGSAAVEYGVFAAGISASILMAIKEIGPNSTGCFPPSWKLCPELSRLDSEPVRDFELTGGQERGAASLHSPLQGDEPVNRLLLSASRETHYHPLQVGIRPGQSSSPEHDTSLH
jgi:Flp pilus assembly pilin Flp